MMFDVNDLISSWWQLLKGKFVGSGTIDKSLKAIIELFWLEIFITQFTLLVSKVIEYDINILYTISLKTHK